MPVRDIIAVIDTKLPWNNDFNFASQKLLSIYILMDWSEV